VNADPTRLQQVFMNLAVNARDASSNGGTLKFELDHIQVEEGETPPCPDVPPGSWNRITVKDTGEGIPLEVLPHIFEPFYTTKPVGEGTGLGLNISYNIIEKHAGEIKVYSKPGKTRFQISLPVDFQQVHSGDVPLSNSVGSDDDKLRQILESTKTVAVVGISDKQDQVNHTVPKYLQSQGYKIIPINPALDEVLGEVAYPDLLSVPEPIDVVEIFRRTEAVPEIVDQAIDIGAKVVWMQEGVINEFAAETAREAGLDVVMDTCMRASHKRLWAE